MFTPYKGYGYSIREEARQVLGYKVNAYEGLELLLAQHWLLHGAPGTVPMSDKEMSYLAEKLHYGTSHHVVYVAKNLGNLLIRQKMQDIPVEHLRLPFRIFELCPEDGVLLPDGRQMPSLLVFANMKMPEQKALSRILVDSITNFYRATSAVDLPLSLRYGEDALRMVLETEPTPFAKQADIFRVMFKIPDPLHGTASKVSVATACFDVTKFKHIEDVLDNSCPFNRTGRTDLDDMREVHEAVLRLALSTLCYMNCADAQVTEMNDRNRPRLGNVPPQAILLGRDEKASPGCHLRSGHFRLLQNECFHRDDNGKARIVWVRPTIVSFHAPPAEPDQKTHEISVRMRAQDLTSAFPVS